MKTNRLFRVMWLLVSLILFFALCLLLSCGAGGDGDSWANPKLTLSYGVAADDLDLDGAVDIVAAFSEFDHNSKKYATIILNDINFPGSFFLSDEFELQGSIPTSITLGDLNDDGYSDIVIGTDAGDYIFILFQDSSLPGQFFVPFKITVGKFTGSLAIGDLNEDGVNDLAISGNGLHLSILFQDLLNPGIFLPLVNLSITSDSVAIGDLNGDLINDIALTGDGKVKLLFQDSGMPGNFSAPVILDAGTSPTDVKIGDLDKDGSNDLVIGNWGTPGDLTKGSVSVLLQNSIMPGEFFPADNYNFSCRAAEINLGDLNDDGFLDIAVASWCQDEKITILFQDNANIGKFSRAVKYSCGSDPWSVAVSDLNNDNLNDLIISENSLVIRFQDPVSPGYFLARTKIY